jgi:hypothetical protein
MQNDVKSVTEPTVESNLPKQFNPQNLPYETVFTPELLVAIFPALTIKKVGGPKKRSAHYNLNVESINGPELIALGEIYKKSNVDIYLRRYGKGITIKVTPEPNNLFKKLD